MKQLDVDENMAKSANRKVTKLLIITSFIIILTIYESNPITFDHDWQWTEILEEIAITALLSTLVFTSVIFNVKRECSNTLITIRIKKNQMADVKLNIEKTNFLSDRPNTSIFNPKDGFNGSVSENDCQIWLRAVYLCLVWLFFAHLVASLLNTTDNNQIPPISSIDLTRNNMTDDREPTKWLLIHTSNSIANEPSIVRKNTLYITIHRDNPKDTVKEDSCSEYFLFALSLTTLYSASLVNSKKRNIISAFTDYIVAQNLLDTVDVIKMTILRSWC
ncbi:hypothetical protein CHUAL_012159 [Chamberlinius hualienensis]